MSVIRNLISYFGNEEIENHVIYTIEESNEKNATIIDFPEAKSVQIFRYNRNWNFYYTCKQLAKLLPDEHAVIVAHDWLELGMCSNLGLQNPVVHILHGDYEYYYQLAEKHKESIDRYIAINPVIAEKLQSNLIDRKLDISYKRFPVPGIQAHKDESATLRIVYCGNDLNSHSKQFELLPLINASLAARDVQVSWSIIGYGIAEDKVRELMKQKQNVFIYSNISNKEVLHIMADNDLILLPSIHEGFPVSIVEGMKCGLVPLVTDWDGATAELIKEGESGFYFAIGDAQAYAEKIAKLHHDRKLLKTISERAATRANELFDPVENTLRMEEVFIESAGKLMYKNKKRVYGSRLDMEWLPNGVVSTIRQMLKS